MICEIKNEGTKGRPKAYSMGFTLWNPKGRPKAYSTGFSLIEIILSISAIALIAGISIPVYQSFQVRNDLDIAATSIVHSLRRAQVLSQASDGDISSGVYVQSGSITLFRGASYASRNIALDETFEIPISITPSGMAEVVFTKFTGLPLSVGTITLNSVVNKTAVITINGKGTINY